MDRTIQRLARPCYLRSLTSPRLHEMAECQISIKDLRLWDERFSRCFSIGRLAAGAGSS
jgi:hypothetical protein